MLVKTHFAKSRRLKIQNCAETAKVVEVKEVKTSELLQIRTLILCGLTLLVFLCWWLLKPENRGSFILYFLLLISIGYKLLKVLFEWYHYWSVSIPVKPALQKRFSVDMLTTATPGEPYAMTESTLRAMVAVRYPHNTYLCDEGNDPILKQICKELDVIHISRDNRLNAKAGNINNALKYADGEICVILDPDHEPLPEFLDDVLPYFENNDVGYVQIVQAYQNSSKSWIARGAAEQTFTFYGPLMMGMNSYGTAQVIGANCTFRRAALNSIGGHAPGLAEDMHTAMQLHAKGWKSVYVPKILARGLVPTNLAAYYKQQLKWSRGTFELLFYVVPRLFKHFSNRQKIHYLLLPLHFAAGIISIVDIFLPILSLLSGYSPLKFEKADLFTILLPVVVFEILIRQYAQRWLLEKNELGFHLNGGILLIGTWWVHTLGFIYTLFRINVPYISTPKDDERSNNFILSLPNLFICAISLTAIIIGLNRDLSPFSLTMAGFCILNVLFLACTILGSQQVLAAKIKQLILDFSLFKFSVRAIGKISDFVLFFVYQLLRNGAIFPALFILVATAWIKLELPIIFQYKPQLVIEKVKQDAFYTGIYMPQVQELNSLGPVEEIEKAIGKKFDIVSVYHFWGPESIKNFPMKQLQNIAERGNLPMITWEPWVSSFEERKDAPGLRRELRGLSAIGDGIFDVYIKSYANKIREFGHPVFIRFAHEPDNPQYPWSATGENTSHDYIKAWRRVVALFAESGVHNVSWVYNPWNEKSVSDYYPGNNFVDWIGITCLNYGNAAWDGKWRTFKELYQPFRTEILKIDKPVMLAEFGSTNYGGDGDNWVKESLASIRKEYKEIRSVVLFNSNQDKNWINDWRPINGAKYIDWTFRKKEAIREHLMNLDQIIHSARYAVNGAYQQSNSDYESKLNVRNSNKENYFLKADGKPFYIKGVAYNAEHSWQDGNHPLTRNQLEKDFSEIKDMGANTIRRYHPSLYDQNIFLVANKKALKVIYGFWFDPTIDYFKDSTQVEAYTALVKEKVKAYKDEPSILAWSIGNETSGLLKKHFEQPYLGVVRQAYMRMLENMAKTIKQIDTSHAVTTSLEHSWQLPGEVKAFSKYVPSLDIIGVNSYYEDQISLVDKIFQEFDPKRPYYLSEFGPKGYWNPELTDFDRQNNLLEKSDWMKATLYAKEWKDYIFKHRARNAGGVAFCWSDRFEGTATWFGITDFKGRKKLAFHALKSVWNNGSTYLDDKFDSFISGPLFPLKPGGEYEFTAKISAADYKNLEWFVYEEGSFIKKNIIKKTFSNRVVISIPYSHSDLRLYVIASDKKGNVLTASVVINVYKGVYNEGL
ncbi:MAG: glycosyltransferase [Flavobacterium sp.]|nr:MAG: glycosyltransferase [Flavobacterium sp.]